MVEQQCAVNCNVQCMNGFGNCDAISAKCNRAGFACPPLSCCSADDNGFGFVWVERESVEREPSVNSIEAVVHHQQRTRPVQSDVKLSVVGILSLCVLDAERLDDVNDGRHVERKNKGPSTDPCGYPYLQMVGSD
jgi:hypothetical protein